MAISVKTTPTTTPNKDHDRVTHVRSYGRCRCSGVIRVTAVCRYRASVATSVRSSHSTAQSDKIKISAMQAGLNSARGIAGLFSGVLTVLKRPRALTLLHSASNLYRVLFRKKELAPYVLRNDEIGSSL